MVALLTRRHPDKLEAPPSAGPAKSRPTAPNGSVSRSLFSFSGHPGGVTVGCDRSIYVSDRDSGTIWRVAADGAAEPFVSGPATGQVGSRQTRLYAPAGIAARPDGSLVVAEPGFHRVSLVEPDGSIRVLAGSANGYRDGRADRSMFRHPADVAVGRDGTCYVADTGNHRIRTISPDGLVTTLAGSIYDFGDGQGPHGRFRMPAALDVDGEGTCYVADTGNHTIRRITPDGQVTTIAGTPPGGHRDGTAREAGLLWPGGIAADGGSSWVADFGNRSLRHVGSTGETITVSSLAGIGHPAGVCVLPDGEVVLAGFSPGGLGRPRGFLINLGHPGVTTNGLPGMEAALMGGTLA